MSEQLAKLFLRGKLINKTAKNLSKEELEEVERYCYMVWSDPDLANTKTIFCSKLGWMINSAYQDLETAMQEVWIVYWKTTVDILFHRPKQEMINIIQATCAKCKEIKVIDCSSCNATGVDMEGSKCTSCYGRKFSKTNPSATCKCGASATLVIEQDLFSMTDDEARECYSKITGKPAPEKDLSILLNPVQRRKFYKTTLWTYLKQIINENKPKTHKVVSTIRDYAEKVALSIINEIISESQKNKIEPTVLSDGTACIEFNTNLISLENVMKIRNLQDMMIKENVEVSLQADKIIVKKIGKTEIILANVKKTARVNYVSFSQPDENSDSGTYLYPNAFVEAIAPPSSPSEFESIDGLSGVRKNLDESSQKIFDLIINPPDDYAAKYSVNPVRRSNVSKFLGIPKSEVDAVWDKIQKATIKAGLHY